jgi:formylglycine-generating enzyme required for sulfatase activity
MSAERAELMPAAAVDAAIVHAREVLALHQGRLPPRGDAARAVCAIEQLRRTGHTEAIDELLTAGFLRGSEERYEQYVRPFMRHIHGGRFEMGSDPNRRHHFCGEAPGHNVEVTPFLLSEQVVVNALFVLFDDDARARPSAQARKPVVEVSWFDATLFAMWVGCRLPTEAEWELACGAGSAGEWCCEHEADLPTWAWYSENAQGEIHEAAARAPNAFGLFDMHGNVWEWCRDCYDQDYYARSPTVDPVNLEEQPPHPADRVTRGGSMHSLAEMCRTRYRFHEPPAFWATDLGFRLARNAGEEVRPHEAQARKAAAGPVAGR